MRLPVLIAALLTALALPSAARADYFTYIPSVGPTVTFTLDPSQIYNVSPYNAIQYGNVMFSNGTTGNVTFFTPSFSTIYSGGPQDLSIGASESSPGAGNQFGENYYGAQIYSGNIGNNVHFVPTFSPGVYQLVGYPVFAGTPPVTATFCVDTACNVAPTPEPTSLYLVGSGVLGLFGIGSRFRKA